MSSKVQIRGELLVGTPGDFVIPITRNGEPAPVLNLPIESGVRFRAYDFVGMVATTNSTVVYLLQESRDQGNVYTTRQIWGAFGDDPPSHRESENPVVIVGGGGVLIRVQAIFNLPGLGILEINGDM